MSASPRFGNSQALHKHDRTVQSPHKGYNPPAPGHYEVGTKGDIKYPSPRASAFGGNLSKEDRTKTGLHGVAMRGRELPGPNSYSVDASEQHIKTKQRAPTFKFGSSTRESDTRVFTSKNDTDANFGGDDKLASPRTVDQDPNRRSAGRGVPGPGRYGTMHGPSGYVKPKSPSYSFGLPENKKMHSETGEKIGPGTYTPGSTLGTQPVSTRPSSPRVGMGTSTRDREAYVSAPDVQPLTKTQSPGPSKYNTVSGVGKQVVSNRHSANAWSFGTDDKSRGSATGSPRGDAKAVGPGAYDQQSMLGLQQQSPYKSYGGFKFGTSDRIPIGNHVG